MENTEKLNYTEQSSNQQINLISIVDDLLTIAGHTRPQDWKRYLHPDAHTTTDLGIQRFLINRCFRVILGDVTTENTMDSRYCLVDTGEFKDWIRLFKTGVVPQLVRLNLPNAIN